VVVVLLVVLAYLPSLGGGWIWDDHYLLENSPAMHDLRRVLLQDVWGGAGNRATELYRPLAMITHYFTQQLLPGPFSDRLLNLVLHLVCTLAVAQLSRALGASRAAAWLGASFFALHPAVTEPVAWITGRHDLVPATLLLLAWWAWQVERPWLCGVLLALCPFGKEPYLLAVVSMPLWMWGSRRFHPGPLVLGAVGVGVYLAIRQVLGLPLPAGAALEQPVAALGALGVRGLELLLVPDAPDALALYRPSPLMGGGLLLVLVGASLLSRGKPWLVAMLAPWVILAPTAPASAHIGLVADRYYYPLLEVIGVASAVGLDWLLRRLSRIETRIPVQALPWLLPLALLPFSLNRALDWRTDEALWTSAMRHNPNNPYAAFHLAFELHTHQNNCQAAVPLYRRALDADPRAGSNLMACLVALDALDLGAAMGPELAMRPDATPATAINTARIFLKKGDWEAAKHWAQVGIEREPGRLTGWLVLGEAAEKQGDREAARKAYAQALSLAPGEPTATAALARLSP
jgi:tetratricopeptide (TPR) repeat protein